MLKRIRQRGEILILALALAGAGISTVAAILSYQESVAATAQVQNLEKQVAELRNELVKNKDILEGLMKQVNVMADQKADRSDITRVDAEIGIIKKSIMPPPKDK